MRTQKLQRTLVISGAFLGSSLGVYFELSFLGLNVKPSLPRVASFCDCPRSHAAVWVGFVPQPRNHVRLAAMYFSGATRASLTSGSLCRAEAESSAGGNPSRNDRCKAYHPSRKN